MSSREELEGLPLMGSDSHQKYGHSSPRLDSSSQEQENISTVPRDHPTSVPIIEFEAQNHTGGRFTNQLTDNKASKSTDQQKSPSPSSKDISQTSIGQNGAAENYEKVSLSVDEMNSSYHNEVNLASSSGVPLPSTPTVDWTSVARHKSRSYSPILEAKETLNAKSEYILDVESLVHKVNQYHIRDEIGRGSFGAVHLADDGYGNEFAVKEFSKSRLRKRAQSNILRRPHPLRRPGQEPTQVRSNLGLDSPLHGPSTLDTRGPEGDNSLDLIKQELSILRKLNHPNLVSLVEVLDDPEEDSLYMVLEICKKGVIMKVGLNENAEPYNEESCRVWFRDLILGVEYLHSQGIIHRDIKPDNLLLTADDILKITDFGVAEMFERQADMKDLFTAKSAGSPAFLSPELCVSSKDRTVSGKAVDIWAMGITLFCLRFGRLPFSAESVLDLYDTIRNKPIEAELEVQSSLENISDAFTHLICGLLEKDPNSRITMSQIREHPWVTKDGADPLLSYEENVKTLLEPSTKTMLNNTIESTSVTELRKDHRLCRVGTTDVELSESGHASSLRSNIFSGALISVSSRSSVIESIEQQDASSGKYYPESNAADPESDIRSVISETDDIHSLASHKRTRHETTAEEHLGILLAQRSELGPLYQEALQKLGKSRFVENFRRLLKRYYLDLSLQAHTNLQRATIDLLRSRWARIRISQCVVDILQPENEEAESQIEQYIIEAGRKVLDLESWIATNEGLAPPLDDIDDALIYEESSDDEDDEGDNPSTLPNVSQMEEFLIGGDSFRNLSVNMRLFLLPTALSSLTRIVMSIPEEQIWFSTKDDLSLSNRTKIWIENRTTDKWNWWPLKPPMQFLQKDQVRIHWRCHCGTHLWSEISSLHAESYQALIQERGSKIRSHHLCKARCHKSIKRINPIILAQAAVAGVKNMAYSYTGSSASGMTTNSSTTSAPSSTSASTTVGSSTDASGATTPRTSLSLGSIGSSGTILNAETLDELFVLFGAKGSRRTLELAQINSKIYTDDETFFRDLRTSYKQLRGFWRYWFSVWRLSYCDFVKWEKIRANRIIYRGKDLPTSPLYAYNPRPPNSEDPPISQHEFELAFASCPPRCPLSFIHDCVEAPIGNFALERIPKRKSALEIKINSMEFAWGIQAQHTISMVGLVVYHILILVGTFGFWGWWMRSHPGDLQSAAVPLTTVAVFLSLFWSAAGVLKILREPI